MNAQDRTDNTPKKQLVWYSHVKQMSDNKNKKLP